ncbi:MAG: SDR family oxidoreductase [Gammaproteobacteria bacterium]|jgi:3-oxoacyl-[acyl-carrier protein] reductase|nr:SDR family oxidoreductase [Gammaproteobacteria bacterium]
MELKSQVALVTGAARGLGLQIAEDLAREGVNVCGTDIRMDLLEANLNRISTEHQVETLAIEADVSVASDVKMMVGKVFEKWGELNILVNNAGIRRVAAIDETSTETWDQVHSTNLKSQFLCTREVLNQGLLKQNEGVIIFISSGSGKVGEENGTAYCASKWGIMGFAESVAKDLKETKIRVTTITPGMIWTPMAEESEVAHLDLEWLDSKDVSNAVMFCIKQDADTIIPELRIYHRAQI